MQMLPYPQTFLQVSNFIVSNAQNFILNNHDHYTDVGFFLSGSTLPNNSMVLLSDIGEGSGGLYCLTDRTECCSAASGGRNGSWRLPHGEIATSNTSINLYTTRAYSSIILNRRNGTISATGIFSCLVPDAENVLRVIHVGIFQNYEEGMICT